MTEKYLTRTEVAALLKVSKTTLSDWAKKELLKPYKLGRTVRYKESEVRAKFENL